MTLQLHGARPVPVDATAPTRWTAAAPSAHPSDRYAEPPLRAMHQPTTIPRVPDDHAEVVQMALGPLRQWATTPVVGLEGGAGRTTVTRLLGRAFATIRKSKLAAVDAVPLWGGLTAAVTNPEAGAAWTVHDLAATTWPPPVPVDQLLAAGFAADGPVPTLPSSPPGKHGWPSPAVIDEAIRRASAIVELTLIDTVADPASAPVREMIGQPRITPVWVCTATQAGLWCVGEAISFLEHLGADHLAARSVIAAVAHHRHWPATAAAAEVQLTGRGLEIIRIPYSHNPLDDHRCARAANRLLAAVVARSA